MNLFIREEDYDFHTLLKVAEIAGIAGVVGFHEAEGGYLISFPQTENVQQIVEDYQTRLKNLEHNIWM